MGLNLRQCLLNGQASDQFARLETREHLHYVLAGSIADRLRGAALLGVGIVLAMAGSVVSRPELNRAGLLAGSRREAAEFC